MKRAYFLWLAVVTLYFSAGLAHAQDGAMSAGVFRDVATPAGEYIIGVDDVLDISVIKPEPMASTVTVAPDGAITFPYIGNVQARGLTLPKLQEVMERRLADGYMEFPVVSVSLRLTRSKKFIIYGEVVRPGTYPVEEDMTVLHAIAVAGGFVVPGATGKIKLQRPSEITGAFKTIELGIAEILSNAREQAVIYPGDTIVISVDKFFISGRVARPGAYPVEEGMTLLHAITVAGGFSIPETRGKVKHMRTKGADTKPETFESDIASILSGAHVDRMVRSGDTIVVSMDEYFISGQVTRPGSYPAEDSMTLLQAITTAGGFTVPGATGRIKLLRSKEGTSEAVEIFVSDVASILNGGHKEIAVYPGDTIIVSVDKFFVSGRVARPGAYPVEENMTLLHAISIAGGLTDADAAGRVKHLRPKEAGSDFEFEVIRDLGIDAVLNGTSWNTPVLPGDTIVVSSDKFFVYGEVNRPGVFPLETNTTALTAISMAGGFTKFGSASRVKVLRMDPKAGKYLTQNVDINGAISGNSKADVLLQPGDILVVSESAF